ncbi:hypothetical protein ONE63_007011 [Megalurothrips usitatus]|uniref:Osteopetrosis-associated transmembrane protein 1 n=1 Tax=Megalurothrips usitatus TaxID=439358 RepID=A0AAV7XRH3_9NEOP|nr:hypothetical protein ONE63_007011 [Megalurothrips usitatus]
MIYFKPVGIFVIIFLFYSSESSSLSQTFGESANNQTNCTVLLESYADASASFTFCAVNHARPIRICEKCVTLYHDVYEAHYNIVQVEDGKGNKKCKEQLMNLDRLEVIEDGYNYIEGLWDRASCKSCFESKNSTMLTNNTINFMNMLNVTHECFNEHKVDDDKYDKTVCKDCETKYCDMNKFYDSLKTEQDNLCMDVVDSMNITRMMWNDKLHCKDKTRKPDVVFLAVSSTVAALPVLFYLGAKLFTTVIRNQLQMQKRLAEVLRPSTSAAT